MTRNSAIIAGLLFCAATMYGSEIVPAQVVGTPTICDAASGIGAKLTGAAQLLGQAKNIACHYVKNNPGNTALFTGLVVAAGFVLGNVAKKVKKIHSEAREELKRDKLLVLGLMCAFSVYSYFSLFSASGAYCLLRMLAYNRLADSIIRYVLIGNICTLSLLVSLL